MGAGDEKQHRRSKNMAEEKGSLSGLSDQEAKEFNAIFVSSFIGFTTVAVIAHILAWMWRPWLPSAAGYGMLETAQQAIHTMLS
jgi:light-harvesting complex 1 beta chain